MRAAYVASGRLHITNTQRTAYTSVHARARERRTHEKGEIFLTRIPASLHGASHHMSSARSTERGVYINRSYVSISSMQYPCVRTICLDFIICIIIEWWDEKISIGFGWSYSFCDHIVAEIVSAMSALTVLIEVSKWYRSSCKSINQWGK